MHDFFVKINQQKVKIDKRIFLALLDLSPIQALASYKKAISSDEITFTDLKDLAFRAYIPYPLFFASKDKLDKQMNDKKKNLEERLPTKHEMQLNPRGTMKAQDVELIVKDLGRKQMFLSNRVLPGTTPNAFVGLVAKKAKLDSPNEEIAKEIRDYLGIDLTEMRNMPKDRVLNYLCGKAEDKGILISFSSYNFMPQNIDKNIGLSGLCIKDKRFPYIFINTRDGDEKPKIIESSGRQIFTVVAMLVSIAMNKFMLSTKTGRTKDDPNKKIFAVVGDILIPKEDLRGVTVSSLDDLKARAKFFKVTPSMILNRLRQLGRIDPRLYVRLRDMLLNEVKKSDGTPRRQPSQMTGYGKYNGERLSREIVKAHRAAKVSSEEVKNILFRKGKMDSGLFRDYTERYR